MVSTFCGQACPASILLAVECGWTARPIVQCVRSDRTVPHVIARWRSIHTPIPLPFMVYTFSITLHGFELCRGQGACQVDRVGFASGMQC
jgi:hypothetical protein